MSTIEAFETRDRDWFEVRFEKLRGEIKDAKQQTLVWVFGMIIAATVVTHYWR